MKKYLDNKYMWLPMTVIVATVILWTVSLLFMDNDGWFILTNGRYILEHGIPKENPFAFMKDLDIVIQQWLWSVINYTLYDSFGPAGIYMLCAVLLAASVSLYAAIAKLHQIPASKAVLYGLLIFTLMSQFLSIRPTFVTVTLLLWQVYVLESYKIKGGKWKLSMLVLISLLEINLHAAIWSFHFVFMLPYLVPEIKNPFVTFRKWPMDRKPLFITLIPMFFAGFLNPYGIKNMMYLFYSYGDTLKSAGIAELRSPALSDYGFIIMVVCIITAVWISKHKEVDSSFFYIMCGTAVLSLSHVRNLIYFLLGFLLFMVGMMNENKFSYEKQKDKSTLILWIATLMFLIPATLDIAGNVHTAADLEDNETTPVKAVEYLKENDVDKNTHVYTDFNTGGLLEWNGFKSYMDPRPELFFKSLNGKEDVFDEYNEVRKTVDQGVISEFIEKREFEYMIITDDSSLRMYMEIGKCGKAVVDGNGYKMYVLNR